MPTRTQRFVEALANELLDRNIMSAIEIQRAHPAAAQGALTRLTREFRARPGNFADALRLGTECLPNGSNTDLFGHYRSYYLVPAIKLNESYFGSSPDRVSAREGLVHLRRAAGHFVVHEMGHRSLRAILATRNGRREVRAIFEDCFDWRPDLIGGESGEEIPKRLRAPMKRALGLEPEDPLPNVDEAFACAYEWACLRSQAHFCRAVLQLVSAELGGTRYSRISAPDVNHLAKSFGLELETPWR